MMFAPTKEAQSKETNSINAQLPLDYVVFGSRIVIQVIDARNQRPQEAFLSQTENALKKKNNLISLHPWDSNKPARDGEFVGLAGLIFHTSRCGSTLLCNMLDKTPNCITIRESAVLNKVIHDDSLIASDKLHLFKELVNMYVQYTCAFSAKCIIKFSSHCALKLSFIMHALHGIPLIYLHRKPSEVLHSLVTKPAPWMKKTIAQQLLKSFNSDENRIQFVVSILEKCMTEVIRVASNNQVDEHVNLVNYSDIVNNYISTLGQISSLFNLPFTSAQIEQMNECLLFDSKTGNKRPTGGDKVKSDIGLSTLELKHVNDIYSKLIQLA